MASQSYTYNQAGPSMSQLPNVQWDVPFYKESFEDLVPVPRKPPNPYNYSNMNVSMEEIFQFAANTYWCLQSTRQTMFDESCRRALYNTPTTHRSSKTSDGLFTSSQEEQTFASTYNAGVSLEETQYRRKRAAGDPSTSNVYYVPYGPESNVHVEPHMSMAHGSPICSDLPNSSEFLGLSLGGSWQGSVHGSGHRGEDSVDMEVVPESQFFP
ncbi:hypothetical protein MKW98_028885 [Papaver atlanticum]|uniref:Uncharacterized protein n=1 Tax=Papaver atlanticum TaxID=357466 RepID=A0AAD4S338_9MAGN|nr:hypothetical protein MKW98_028885 [Papaver atlanticum]